MRLCHYQNVIELQRNGYNNGIINNINDEIWFLVISITYTNPNSRNPISYLFAGILLHYFELEYLIILNNQILMHLLKIKQIV